MKIPPWFEICILMKYSLFCERSVANVKNNIGLGTYMFEMQYIELMETHA